MDMCKYLLIILLFAGFVSQGQPMRMLVKKTNHTLISTLDVSQETYNTNRICNSTGYYVAQSFKPTGTFSLSSAGLNMTCSATQTMVCRIGTSSNLTTYLEEITIFATAGTNVWASFPSTIKSILTSGTTYYIGFYCTSGYAEANVWNGSSVYADGSYYYQTGGVGWNCSGNEPARDLAFRIYLNK